MGTEVLVCVKNRKGQWVNSLDSCCIKEYNNQSDPEFYFSWLKEHLVSVNHLLWKNSPFKHSFWNGSSSVEYLCGETLQLVNLKVQHVHSANDLQTTLIVIVSSSEAAAVFVFKLL